MLTRKHEIPISPMPSPALPPFLPDIIHAAENEINDTAASTEEAMPDTGCLLSVKRSSPLSFLCPFFLNLILFSTLLMFLFTCKYMYNSYTYAKHYITK